MSEQTTTLERVKSVILKTSCRDVLVVGADLVSPRFIDIIALLLEKVADGEDHGVNSVVLSDLHVPFRIGEGLKDGEKEPEGMMAECYMSGGTIAINMEETFEKVYLSSCDKDRYSVYALWWHNMIVNILHEALHCNQFISDAKPHDWLEDYMTDKDGFMDRVEKEASKGSRIMLNALAKEYDIEPPAWGDEPFFAKQALYVYAGEDGENTKRVNWLNDRVFIYTETDGEPNPVCTFRGYLHAISGDDPKDPDWAQKLKDVPSIMNVKQEATPANDFTQPAEEAAPITMSAGQDGVYVEYDEMGPEAVEDTTEGVLFAGAQLGAFNMAPAAEMPSIPTTPTPSPTPMADNVAASFGATPQPGAPGTPFTMNGQAVGQNMAPAYTPPAVDGFAPAAAPVTAPTPEAAQVHSGPTQPEIQQLKNLGLAPEEIRNRVYAVANKVFAHIFTHCQFRTDWSAVGAQDGNGFEYPDAVTKMPILLTAEEAQVVYAAAGLDEMGRWHQMRPTSDGKLFGFVTSKANIPMYKIFINANGQQMCRTLMPQNPNKRNDATRLLKPTAEAARAGRKILWLGEGDDLAKKAAPNKTLKAKCTDGQWEIINA